MKETIKTSRTAGYLEKIFRAINADWFGGELEVTRLPTPFPAEASGTAC